MYHRAESLKLQLEHVAGGNVSTARSVNYKDRLHTGIQSYTKIRYITTADITNNCQNSKTLGLILSQQFDNSLVKQFVISLRKSVTYTVVFTMQLQQLVHQFQVLTPLNSVKYLKVKFSRSSKFANQILSAGTNPYFFLKECIGLLLSSVTKLVNGSLGSRRLLSLHSLRCNLY